MKLSQQAVSDAKWLWGKGFVVVVLVALAILASGVIAVLVIAALGGILENFGYEIEDLWAWLILAIIALLFVPYQVGKQLVAQDFLQSRFVQDAFRHGQLEVAERDSIASSKRLPHAD